MDVSALVRRAAELHAAGMAASDNGRPATATRRLRAGLRLLATASTGPITPRDGSTAFDPTLAEIRSRLLISLAWSESERGRVDVGFAMLDEAELDMSDQQRPVLLAQRALLLKRSGRNDLALRAYDEAIRLLAGQPDPLDLVKALNNRSLIHLDAGNVRLARADLDRCGQIAARHGLALHVALSRVNLGCLDVLAGDLPAALGAFRDARDEYQALAPGRLPNLAVERARALVAAGLFGEADRELGFAVHQAVQQRLSHTHADALQVRAEAALLAGRPLAAAQWANEARARFQGRDNARRVAVASLLELRAEYAAAGDAVTEIAGRAQALALRLIRLGLREDARVAALIAARVWIGAGAVARGARIVTRYGPPGRVDRLDTQLLWRLTRAELAMAQSQPAQAARHLAAGMTALHRHRTQFGCLDLQTGATVHGQDLARAGLAIAVASGRTAAVYRWSERARAQALLLPPVRPPADPIAGAALEELRQARFALQAAELAGRSTGSLRTRIEALQRTVRERTWSTPGRRDSAGPVSARFADVQQALGDAALAIYLQDGKALRALVVVDGSATLVALGSLHATEEAVLRLRADLDAQAGRALPQRLTAAVAAATRRDANAVAAAILDPIVRRVGDRDLVVVPTSTLITVPWSVLPGCAGRPVTVTPSATAWHAARLRTPLSEPMPAAGQRVLLVAGPGNERGTAEVQAIAGLHPGATVLTGPMATPAATLAALGGVTIAHIAAHGHHEAENALFSNLDLADGPLLGYDLQHAVPAPRMVILSSCDLGLTDIRPGDETFGMVTALLSAGSSTVVASVARVADEAAMAVMTRYHRGITGRQSPAAALAAALVADPAAGFVCFGAG